MHIALIGAGRPEPLSFLQDQLQQADFTIAVDGGLQAFAQLEQSPTLIVGDFDSVEPSLLEKFSQVERYTLPVHKDQSDMEAAVEWALQKNPIKIEILQGFGKRMDHFWGNCCLTFIRPGIVFLKSIHEILWALPTNQTTFFNEPIGTTISLLPFTAEVHDVLTQDFAYPLRHETLYQNARAISNVVSGKQPSIRFGSGKLAAYILHKDF